MTTARLFFLSDLGKIWQDQLASCRVGSLKSNDLTGLSFTSSWGSPNFQVYPALWYTALPSAVPGLAQLGCWHSLTRGCNSSLSGPWGCGEHLQTQSQDKGEPLGAARRSKVLGVSKGASTELICTQSGWQKALAVHSCPLLASAQPSVRAEGGMIPAQLELDAHKHSVLSWPLLVSVRFCPFLIQRWGYWEAF